MLPGQVVCSPLTRKTWFDSEPWVVLWEAKAVKKRLLLLLVLAALWAVLGTGALAAGTAENTAHSYAELVQLLNGNGFVIHLDASQGAFWPEDDEPITLDIAKQVNLDSDWTIPQQVTVNLIDGLGALYDQARNHTLVIDGTLNHRGAAGLIGFKVQRILVNGTVCLGSKQYLDAKTVEWGPKSRCISDSEQGTGPHNSDWGVWDEAGTGCYPAVYATWIVHEGASFDCPLRITSGKATIDGVQYRPQVVLRAVGIPILDRSITFVGGVTRLEGNWCMTGNLECVSDLGPSTRLIVTGALEAEGITLNDASELYLLPGSRLLAGTSKECIRSQHGGGLAAAFATADGQDQPGILLPGSDAPYTIDQIFAPGNQAFEQFLSPGVTLWRSWNNNGEKVLVSFDPQGALPGPGCVVLDPGTALGELPLACRPGWSFLGWYPAPAGGEKTTGQTQFSRDTTLYARWALSGQLQADLQDGAAPAWLNWSYDSASGAVTFLQTLGEDAGEDDRLVVASYDETGRFLSAAIAAAGEQAAVAPAARLVRLFWVSSSWKPRAESDTFRP